MTSSPSITIIFNELSEINPGTDPKIIQAVNKMIFWGEKISPVNVTYKSKDHLDALMMNELLAKIKTSNGEGSYLFGVLNNLIHPQSEIGGVDLSRLRQYTGQTRVIFDWLLDYHREKEASPKELTTLLDRAMAAESIKRQSSILLSPWIIEDGYCAFRCINNTNPDDVANRVAYIEKTPRIRVKSAKIEMGSVIEPNDNWLCGPKGSGGADGCDPANELYGHDPSSRMWCDLQLLELGYTLS